MNRITYLLLYLLCIPAAASTHHFTGLPLDAGGWTDFERLIQSGYEDARVIFVSDSEGDDASGEIYGIADIVFDANGMFQPGRRIMAFKTIAEGYSRIRDGYPDILLLKRGDSWNESFSRNSAGIWNKSGPSPSARIILSSYGDNPERPLLNTGSNEGFSAGNTDNIIVSGIRIYDDIWEEGNRSRGVNILGSASHHLYEDMVFERNINRVQGYPSGEGFHYYIAFRRNHFIEGNYNSTEASLYVYQIHNFLAEENIFSKPQERSRHFYISPGDLSIEEGVNNVTGVELTRNIFFVSERTGLSIRSGGVIENNLILQNDVFLVGGHGGSGGSIQSAYVRNNVTLEASEGSGDGDLGLWMKNIDGGEVKGNIWTDNTNLGRHSITISITGSDGVEVARNIDISGNIIHARSGGEESGTGIRISGDLEDVENIIIQGNDIQMTEGSSRLISHLCDFDGFTYRNNRYYSPREERTWFSPGGTLAEWINASGETGAEAEMAEYTDPARSVGSYNQSLGGAASTEDFINEALKQSRQNWRPAYTAAAVNNYIREGFDMDPVIVVYGGNGGTPVIEEKDNIPNQFSLHQNYPNPFNPATTISYSLASGGNVSLVIYDILGREVTVLVNEMKPAGNHAVQWDGTNKAGTQVVSGVYFYGLKRDGGYSDMKKMLLIK